MTFPDTPLDLRVQLKLLGEWIDMGPVASIADDFYTDYYTDEYLGRIVWDLRRLPSQNIGITRGGQDETTNQNPGTVSLYLWNEDGYLTPGNPRSPWWTQDGTGWGRNTELRILVGDNVRFHGEVSEIVPEWPQGDISDDLTDEELDDLGAVDVGRLGYAIVNITASGLFRRLGQRTKPLRSAIQRRVTSPTYLDRIADYWPMEDGSDAHAFASGLPSSAGSLPQMQTVGWALASDDSLWGSQALPSVSSGGAGSATAVLASDRRAMLDGQWVVEWNMRIPRAPEELSTEIRVEVNSTGTYPRWRVTIGYTAGSTYLLVQAFTRSGASAVHSTLTDVEHLFGDPWTTFRLRVDEPSLGNVGWSLVWGQVTTGADTLFGFSDTETGDAGTPISVTVAVSDAPPAGVSVGHLIVHDGIDQFWLVGPDVGWQDEGSTPRFARICDEQHVPRITSRYGPAGSGLEDSSTTRKMGVQRPLSTLALLQEAADTENGVLIEVRDSLDLQVVARGARYNRVPVFNLDARDKSQIANPFAPVTDDQSVANDVTASKIDGTSFRVADPRIDAGEDIAVYDQAVSFSMFDDDLVKHYAGWWYHLGTHDGARYPQVTIDLAVCGDTLTTGSVSMIDAWLAAHPLQDRFTISNLPPQHPSYPTVDLIIEGYTETLSPHGWTVTLNCSPAKPWDVARWEVDRYASAGSELVTAIDVDDTTFDVSSVGVPWIDTAGYPGEWPRFFQIGLEVIAVDTITGTSSPQTFSGVTRAVEGYAQAHPAGTSVQIADARVMAL